MDLSSIIIPAVSIGGLGVVFGAGLGFAAVKLAVKQDPKIPLVREALPGANCGACGFTGCDAYASAIVEKGASVSACSVGGASVAEQIAEIMGVTAETKERETAFVKCNGTCDKAKNIYEYYGMDDCNMASQLAGGGQKGCSYGCLGLGSCRKACAFDAIVIRDGIAVIDKDKCVACGQCIGTCPRKLIEFVPESKNIRVACNSKDKGKEVKENCAVGCIGCKMCEKACKFEAVTVTDQLAKIDYEKCIKCGACARKCPTGAIIGLKQKLEKPAEENKETPVEETVTS